MKTQFHTDLGDIPAHWEITELGEVADITKLAGYEFTKHIEYIEDGEIIALRSLNVVDGQLDLSNIKRISRAVSEVLPRSKLFINDLLLTYTGSKLGDTSLIDYNDTYHLAPNVCRLRANEDDDAYFLYVYLRSKIFSRLLDNFKVGSGQPTVPMKNIRRIPLPWPPKEERVNIGLIFSSLTNKIELNRQTNQTLEQIAQALFKCWFVDFEPTRAKIIAKEKGANTAIQELAAQAIICGAITLEQLEAITQNLETTLQQAINEKLSQANQTPINTEQLKTTAALFPNVLVDSELGEIPEGWEVACIDDVCDFQNGYAFKSKEMTKIPLDTYKVFKMGHIKKGGGLNQAGTKDYYEKEKCEKLDRYLIKKGDLLMCMTDMKNNVALLGHTALMDVDDEYILNQRVGMLRSKNTEKANYPFLYILTNSQAFIENLRSKANSGVQVNLSTRAIKDTKFILPSRCVHVAFDEVVERVQETIFSLEAEQESLVELRNSLLPRLLSGELNVTGLKGH